SVPSPYHLRLSVLAGKSRPIRSGARHRPFPCRVVCLRRFFARATKCCSRMIAATVFSLTRQPASRRSSVIRGEPYLPSCAATRVRACGPSDPYADGLRAVVAERGYAPSSAARQLQTMAHLSRWLFDHGLDGHGLTPVVVAQFLEARRAAGYKQRLSARAMAPLLGYLRECGIAAVCAPAVANNPVEVLLAGYRTYLVAGRGL